MLQWQKLIVFIIDKPLLNSLKTLPKTKQTKIKIFELAKKYYFFETQNFLRNFVVLLFSLKKSKTLKTNYLFLQLKTLMHSIPTTGRRLLLKVFEKLWRYWCNLVACKTVDLSVRVQIPGIALLFNSKYSHQH